LNNIEMGLDSITSTSVGSGVTEDPMVISLRHIKEFYGAGMSSEEFGEYENRAREMTSQGYADSLGISYEALRQQNLIRILEQKTMDID
jgi:hypothetical protein